MLCCNMLQQLLVCGHLMVTVATGGGRVALLQPFPEVDQHNVLLQTQLRCEHLLNRTEFDHAFELCALLHPVLRIGIIRV